MIVQGARVGVMLNDALMHDSVDFVCRDSHLDSSMSCVEDDSSNPAALSNSFYFLGGVHRDDR